MSGKSASLRTIGVNAVLAQAGAPVRAVRLTRSPLLGGSSMRVSDSLRPTATPPCAGDCNGDGVVAIDELVRGVSIALGAAPLVECRALDRDGDAAVTVSELIRAASAALDGC